MKKILIVTGSFPPDYSGAGLRALRLTERLHSKYRLDFNVLCLRQDKKNKQKYSQDKTTNNNSPKIKRLNVPSEDGFLFPLHIIVAFFKINYYLLKNHKKIDIIHFFSFSWFNRIVMFSNILFYKKITIMDVTLDGSDDPMSLLNVGRRNKIFSRFTRYLIRKIDHFIVSSEFSLNSCIDAGIERGKISLEPHPCDENVFGSIKLSAKYELRNKLNLPQDKFILLNVGRIQERKNQLFLINTLKKLGKSGSGEFILILIGPYNPNDSYFKELSKKIKAAKLEKQVMILGEKKNVNEYMIASDLFVFASRNEGFPNVISEAITSGLPVVSVQMECINKFINEKTGFMVSNNDKFDEAALNKYSDAVKNIYNNRQLFNRLEIRKYGLSNLSSRKVDKKTIITYKKALALK